MSSDSILQGYRKYLEIISKIFLYTHALPWVCDTDFELSVRDKIEPVYQDASNLDVTYLPYSLLLTLQLMRPRLPIRQWTC